MNTVLAHMTPFRFFLCLPALLALLLTACAPQQGVPLNLDEQKNTLVGVWEDRATGELYCLDADGALGLPGNAARSGLNWSVSADSVHLEIMDVPGSEVQRRSYRVASLSSGGMRWQPASGPQVELRKVPNAAAHIDGFVGYRERMALPPDVLVAAWLTIPGQKKPLALSYTASSGQGKLPFRLHYRTSDLEKVAQGKLDTAQLNAAIYYGPDSLFATAQPVPFVPGQELFLMLNRTLQDDVAPQKIKAPAFYVSEDQNTRLSLESDHLFVLQHTTNSGEKRYEIGRWQQVARNYSIELVRGDLDPLQVALRPTGLLLLQGPQTDIALNLATQAEVTELWAKPLPVRVAGMLSQKGNTVQLTECKSGLPIILDGGKASLRSAGYPANSKATNIFVELEGNLRQYGARATAPSHALDIDQVLQLQPGLTCPTAYAGATLDNTYWRLTHLDGQATTAYPDQAEPHLILRKDDNATGSDGCNNFFMPWSAKDAPESTINFKQGGSTLMMCPQGMEQGQHMLQNLSQAAGWRIDGSVLELRDTAGKVLAIFEAVAL